MKNLPVNPLQALIKKSATQLPVQTGAVDRYAQRLNRVDGPLIILADVSPSMDELAWGRRRRIDLLRESVDALLRQHTDPIRIIAFAGEPDDSVETIPPHPQRGGTAMHLAIDCAAKFNPRATLIISDGQPDDEDLAIAAAHALPGRIDTLYIGPDISISAVRFMRRLAEVGCGRHSANDISNTSPLALTHSITKLLIGQNV
ncbi:vWA domain-containing protein [Pectobacterium brasiliense]|uniref:vWA domain-containing protein n=1 Tax=Pectobacterium brasiliense TaxID=180957 RepID=UPI0032EE5D73